LAVFEAMATHMSDFEQQQRARERTRLVESILQGAETGATAEIERTSLEAEARLKERAETTGSKPAGHAADVLEAQRLLVTEKNLGDRFLRIAKRLEELRMTSTPGSEEVMRLQREFEALRPLLRLTIRSDEFRRVLLTALRVAKHVIEQNVEGSVERVMDRGEQEGMEGATKEAKEAISQTMENIQSKMDRGEDVISDSDWEKLSNELDALFNQFQRHAEFRTGVNQLFELASTLSYQARTMGTRKAVEAVEGIQHETKELVAQFSGEAELDQLIHSIQTLARKLEKDQDAQQWWSEFREHTLRVTQSYNGKQDLEKYRELFRSGYRIFKDHKPRINRIIDRMDVVVTNISNDQLVNRLRESLATLSDDLFWKDQHGNRFFDAEAAGILASSVSDVIRTQFQYLALPRIMHVEEDVSYTLDNLVISATLPEKIEFHLESFGSLDTSAFGVSGQSALQTEIYLTATIRGITARAPNVAFSYAGTTLSEAGLMTITIPKPGADLSIDFVMRPSTRAALSSVTTPTSFSTTTGMEEGGFIGSVGGGLMKYEFVRIKSHFGVSDLEIDYDKKTLSHSVLVPFFTTLFKARIIDRFESGIEEALDVALIALGQQVTSILNEAPNPLSISSFGSMVGGITAL